MIKFLKYKYNRKQFDILLQSHKDHCYSIISSEDSIFREGDIKLSFDFLSGYISCASDLEAISDEDYSFFYQNLVIWRDDLYREFHILPF